MREPVKLSNTAMGLAALSICESLLLSLREQAILSPRETIGILEDAAAAHRNAGPTADDPKAHEAAAAVIDRIIRGTNSVRHS
jgi:hypothetical protein